MRKFLLTGIFAITLAGCGTINPFTNQPNTPADVQNATVQACGFLPTASTVLNILAVGNPAAATAEAVAQAICAAVTPAPKALKGVPTVNGVEIHGRFVR